MDLKKILWYKSIKIRRFIHIKTEDIFQTLYAHYLALPEEKREKFLKSKSLYLFKYLKYLENLTYEPLNENIPNLEFKPINLIESLKQIGYNLEFLSKLNESSSSTVYRRIKHAMQRM